MQSIINSIIKNRNLIIYIFLSFLTFNSLFNNSSIHFNEFGKISTYLNPFGGLKESGIGREGSVNGLEPFLETKFLSWDIESNN